MSSITPGRFTVKSNPDAPVVVVNCLGDGKRARMVAPEQAQAKPHHRPPIRKRPVEGGETAQSLMRVVRGAIAFIPVLANPSIPVAPVSTKAVGAHGVTAFIEARTRSAEFGSVGAPASNHAFSSSGR